MKINGLKWKIKTLDPDDERLNEDATYMGLCVFLEQTIYIRAGMSKEQTKRTILHELIHAIIFSYGLDPDMDEEGICNFVSAHFDELTKLMSEVKNGIIH